MAISYTFDDFLKKILLILKSYQKIPKFECVTKRKKMSQSAFKSYQISGIWGQKTPNGSAVFYLVYFVFSGNGNCGNAKLMPAKLQKWAGKRADFCSTVPKS